MKSINITFIFVILSTAVISYFIAFRRSKEMILKQSKSELTELTSANSELNDDLYEVNKDRDSTKNELTMLIQENKLLQIENNKIKQANLVLLNRVVAKQEYFDEQINLLFDEQMSLLQENKMALKKEFENLANDILENNVLENSLLEKNEQVFKELNPAKVLPC